jgi:cytochrome c oxidase subunit IV
MVSFQGSVSNYSLARRLVIWTLVFILPLAAVSISVALFFLVSWWSLILIFDLLVVLVSISLSGLVFKGHNLVLGEDEILYTKGWSRGRIPYRNMIKVYRVTANGRDAILLVYNEPSTRNTPNRCLSLEQTFTKRDMDSIFSRLIEDHQRFSFPVVDMASLNQIRRDKISIGWVPV